MKTRSLFLIACMLLLSLAASAPAQNTDYLPKKPDKEPQTATEWYDYARWSYINESNTQKARQAVEKAIELQPNLIEALHLRGYMKLDAGDYKGALEDFNSVIQFNPNVTETYMARAETRLRINPKDIDGALADYDLLITQLAARRLVVYAAFDGRSKLRYQKGDLSGALDDINHAVAMGEIDQGVLLRRSLISRKLGNNTEALADLLRLDTYYQEITADTRKEYPQFYREKEEYPYDQNPLASLAPKPKREGGIAVVMPSRGGTGGGIDGGTINSRFKIKSLEEKLSPDAWFDVLDPLRFSFFGDDVSALYYFIGQSLEASGDKERAEAAYTQAIISQPENFAAHFNRAQIRLRDGRLEPAIRDLSWTISQQPKLSEVYAERGLAILLLGHDALAQKDFDIYRALEPAKSAELDKRIAAAKLRRKELQSSAAGR